jgi:NAD(P)-dependent dehydrogenase (short-subunit alcohol dehydrogenase family)
MHAKICLVTGATAGIGEVTARVLAERGATVVGVGRNAEKCAERATRIAGATGNPRVEFLVADLSVQAQVRQLAETFKQRYERLDVLVNNAGAFYMRRQVSAEGIELTFALNHLNYFLLTQLLLDRLVAGAPARVVNVSSDAHRGARIRFEDVEFRRGYAGWTAYGQSKLANVLFTYSLARRLAGTGVTANALHPGFVASQFGHNNGAFVGLALRVIHRLAALPVEAGAQTSLYLATSPEVEGVTGRYFVKQRPVRSDPASYDEAAAERLWVLSENMVRGTAA